MSSRLDDPQRIPRMDPGNMLGAVNRFPDFLMDAARLGHVEVRALGSIENILLVGMGGSGSAADVLHDWLGPRMKVPMLVLRESILPKFVGPQTLLVAVSYSGETGETLAVFRKAVKRGCAVAGIGSGGTLAADCKKLGAPFLRVPQGLLPRAALAPMVGTGALLLESFGFVRRVRVELLEAARELVKLQESLRAEIPGPRNLAKKIAYELVGKVPVVYCLQRMSSVARRAMNQFAENSKVLAKYELLPEAGHNEVVAWQGRDTRAFPIIVRDNEETEGEKVVVGAFKNTLIRLGRISPLEVRTSAMSPLGRILAPILLFDYVSVYLAVQRGVDPTPTLGIQEYRRLLSVKNHR